MILSDADILDRQTRDEIISPFNETQVQPASHAGRYQDAKGVKASRL